MSTFEQAVSQVLNSWADLKIAVDNHLGGAESQAKADWMPFAVETYFKENDDVEQYDMEDFLDTVLETEFNTRVEDYRSVQEVSHLICLLYRLCQEHKLAEVEHVLQAALGPAMQYRRRGDDKMVELGHLEEKRTVSRNRTTFSSQQHATSASSQPTATSDMEEMEVSEEKETDPDGWQVVRRGKRN